MKEFYAAAQGSAKFYEITDWCSENLRHWEYEFPFIFFHDDQEYEWFVLRWL